MSEHKARAGSRGGCEDRLDLAPGRPACVTCGSATSRQLFTEPLGVLTPFLHLSCVLTPVAQVAGRSASAADAGAWLCPAAVAATFITNTLLITVCKVEFLLARSAEGCRVTKQMKANAIGLIESLENLFAEWKTKSFRTQVQEENFGYQDLKKMLNFAPEFLKLKHCLEQTIQIVISALRDPKRQVAYLADKLNNLKWFEIALRGHFGLKDVSSPSQHPLPGRRGHVALLQDRVQSLCSSARGLHGDRARHRELESRATSLLLGFEFEERPGLLGPWEACDRDPRAAGREQPEPDRPGPRRTRGVPKRVYELPGPAPAPGGSEQGALPTQEGAGRGSPAAGEQSDRFTDI
eukprot:bmy_21109T0